MYPKIQPNKCPTVVPTQGLRMNYHQCQMKIVKDGFCRIHHPEAVEARVKATSARYEEKQKQSHWMQLKTAQKELRAAWEIINSLLDDFPYKSDTGEEWLKRNENYRPAINEK